MLSFHRKLAIGEMFGEISAITGKARTSTIVSKNYNTIFALLSKDYKEVEFRFPWIR